MRGCLDSIEHVDVMSEEDPFESVFLSEQRLYREAYQEGTSCGCMQGFSEGWVTGLNQGFRLGQELGYYLGFAETALSIYKDNDRKTRALTALIDMVRSFQHLNIASSQYQSILSQIRTKFSQVLSLLQAHQSLHPHKQDSKGALNF